MRWRFLAGGVIVLVLAAAVTVALVFVSAKASLSSDPNALGKIKLPMGGGSIQSVSVVTGPHSRPVPVELRDDRIWPKGTIPAHTLLQIQVVIKRPGWVGWLAGKTQRLQMSETTPSASLRQHYITLRSGAPVVLKFKKPILVYAVGPPSGHLVRHVLSSPQSEIQLPRTSLAGSVLVSAQMRTWETSPPVMVSWFPAGASATAVATPAPGTQILPTSTITLTFSKPVSKALGSNRPPVSPTTAGAWQMKNSHTIVFEPQGYGYGLAATVHVALPNGVRLLGGQANGSSSVGTWTVPGGTTTRLQQLLAQLGYLPLTFNGPKVAPTTAAQVAAAAHPPSGTFDWRYANTPSSLKSQWAPGASGVMTKGALMAFENDQGLATDGVAGPAVWKSLIAAAVEGKSSPFGYTYVMVQRNASPQSLTLWHNGHTVLTTAVNTGIAAAPTAPGTFAVFEHLRTTTMSGTNPDGSHYSDPGIQYVSYFNGGDALHAFTRAQFGFPQSLGCVEMALGAAGQVWPYTPIGTLVNVA